MSRKLRLMLGLGLALGGCAATVPPALADGLPVPFDAGDNIGISSPEADVRYSTVAAGDDTVALRVLTGTGEIQRTTQLRGDWGVPLVAYDSTPSGLSADGRTLVLIRPRTGFPRRTTEFAVFDAEGLELRRELTLRDDFSFDALSPNGRLMYLIHYPDPRDPTAYEVRAYDLERERLLSDPIVDPNEEAEEMAGFPQTRAVGPDGRWAYTLYDPADRDHPPFIHALDTQRAKAVCIDLDLLADQKQIWRLGLQPSADGSTLAVVDRGEPIASVDLETFQVSDEAIVAADDPSGVPWAAIAVGLALLAAAGTVLVLRLRGSVGGSEDGGECEPAR